MNEHISFNNNNPKILLNNFYNLLNSILQNKNWYILKDTKKELWIKNFVNDKDIIFYIQDNEFIKVSTSLKDINSFNYSKLFHFSKCYLEDFNEYVLSKFYYLDSICIDK